MSTKTPMTPDNPTVTPESIMQLGLGFWGSKTLLSAIELGVFTELAKSPLRTDDLTARLQLHSRGARDFFDALVALGMLERENDVYRNTQATDLFLDRNKPTYLGGMLEIDRLLWVELDYAAICRVAISRGGVRSVLALNERPHSCGLPSSDSLLSIRMPGGTS